MDTRREEAALRRLPAQKYTIRMLVKAVVSVAGALSFVFAMFMKDMKSQISRQVEEIKARNVEKTELNNRLMECEQQAREREKQNMNEQVEYERARARQKDSITIALLTAQRALKNAK